MLHWVAELCFEVFCLNPFAPLSSPLALPVVGALLTHEVSAFHTIQDLVASPLGFAIKILI